MKTPTAARRSDFFQGALWNKGSRRAVIAGKVKRVIIPIATVEDWMDAK